MSSRKKNEPIYPTIVVQLPYKLYGFVFTGPSSKEIPMVPIKDKEAYKKFFVGYLRDAMERALESSDEELISEMGMPQMKGIIDYAEDM